AKAPGEPRPLANPANTLASGTWHRRRNAVFRPLAGAGRVAAWWVGGTRAWRRLSSLPLRLSAVKRRLAPRNSRLTCKPQSPAAVGRSPVALFARSSTAALSCSRMDAKSVWPRSKCRPWRPRKAALHRAAAAALDALAGGDEVVLRRGEAGSDRYG